MAVDRTFLNVILLGFGFMFVFTAFQTMGNIEKTILTSISEDDENFKGDAYTSLAIIYAVFAVCNWVAPSIISLTGPRIAMIIGAITYLLFIASFLLPKTWLLYVASAIMGAGAAVIWTGQGNYLTLNSAPETVSRNSGIFWAMLQASMLLGNLFVYFQFQGQTEIDHATRTLVFLVLIGVAVVGIVFLAILRMPPSQGSRVSESSEDAPPSGPLDAFKAALKLSMTKEMLLLAVTFFYTGIELSFYSGVYGPSIGFTLQIAENAKSLIGMSGIFIGVGEIIGGLLFGILGNRTSRWGRDPIVISGFILHIIAFFLIFLNLPNDAPFEDTHNISYINPPNAILAIFCSFLLGFGDACFNTQIYSILAGVWSDHSAEAFALFKFVQSVSAAACFFYSSHVGLHVQLGILIVLSIFGTITFVIVEWMNRRSKKQEVLLANGSQQSNPSK